MRCCGSATAKPVEMVIDDGVTMIVQAGHAPIINGVTEKLMRVGCGSATIGMFAKQWHGHVDEVVVVDDHITGVLTEHEAGKGLEMTPSGIKINGRRSTPGRYFQVAEPGTGWGGTNVEDPLTILKPADPKVAWPGMRLLMISTTGEQCGLLHSRRGSGPAEGRDHAAACSPWPSGSPKTANRRFVLCCSWAAPAARCARASRRTRCA